MAGACRRFHLADRLGAGQCGRGRGEPDRRVAVHRFAHTVARRAQYGVAISFWLIAPFIAAESVHNLVNAARPETTVIGIVLTATALALMPLLGRAKQRLGASLNSKATTGEGAQNYLCAAQAAAVLLTLAVIAVWPGGWWLDPAVGVTIAGVAMWQGLQAWRGRDCGC